ncbi:Hypothetical protein D9617_46g064460 [Elsinoe fawcettii]|nr:Hypothetical protein D9617_46g064460 [Elsinoe fawcettii]
MGMLVPVRDSVTVRFRQSLVYFAPKCFTMCGRRERLQILLGYDLDRWNRRRNFVVEGAETVEPMAMRYDPLDMINPTTRRIRALRSIVAGDPDLPTIGHESEPVMTAHCAVLFLETAHLPIKSCRHSVELKRGPFVLLPPLIAPE